MRLIPMLIAYIGMSCSSLPQNYQTETTKTATQDPIAYANWCINSGYWTEAIITLKNNSSSDQANYFLAQVYLERAIETLFTTKSQSKLTREECLLLDSDCRNAMESITSIQQETDETRRIRGEVNGLCGLIERKIERSRNDSPD